LVIRINEVGRAKAVTYDSFAYQPHEARGCSSLMTCNATNQARNRAGKLPESLYYLDRRLAETSSNKKNKTIETSAAGVMRLR
jgi:hypothetical protein